MLCPDKVCVETKLGFVQLKFLVENKYLFSS